LTINGKPLRELARTKGKFLGEPDETTGLFSITLTPEDELNTLALWFEGNDLKAKQGSMWLNVDELAEKKRQTPTVVLAFNKKTVETYDDQGGLIGDYTSNPFFTGNKFFLRQTSLTFKDFFHFGASDSLSPIIRGVHFEKLEGVCYPYVNGLIDFTDTYSRVLIPLAPEKHFFVIGATVTFLIDGSKI
jgi:hypothetical protein